MRDYEELVRALRENAEWADGDIWEVPIMLPDNLKQAADAIEKLVSNADKFKWISTAERQPEESEKPNKELTAQLKKAEYKLTEKGE